MKWAMVLAGILVLSMCSSTKSAAPPTGDEPASTTVAEESTTTTSTSTTTTEPPTTTPPEEAPDLSGDWQGTKVAGGKTEEGTVTISQTGLTFTLSFSDGFECRPADSCKFYGTVEVLENDDGDTMYLWLANNGGSAGTDGGTYETFFGLQAYSDVYPEDDGSELPASVDIVTGEEVVVSGGEGDDYELPETVDILTKEGVDTSGFFLGIGQSVFRGGGQEKEWEIYVLLRP